MPSTKLYFALLVTGLTFMATPVWAKPDAMPAASALAPITTDQLVTWVLEANPGLRSITARAAAAAYRVDPAASLDDPTFAYSAAPLTANGDRGLNQKLDFNQAIPWPGTLAARQDVARYQARAADRDVDAKRLAVIAQAKSAYAEWQFVHAALAIHHVNQKLLDELITTAEARYATGRARKQDVLQAELELGSLDGRLLALRSSKLSVQASINALLNRPPYATLPSPVAMSAQVELPTLQSLQTLAVEHHPELLRLAAEVSVNEGRIALAKKAFYPDFQIGLGYNSLWDNADKRPTVGVSISLPLNRSKRRAHLKRAEAERLRAQWTLVERRADLWSELAQSHAKASEMQSTVALYQHKLIPLAAEYLAAALADYASGRGAFLNVISAEQRTLSTELGLARARADSVRQLAELERWVGGPFRQVETSAAGDQS